MLKIVTDGGADMPEGWQEAYEIHMLPLRIRFGEQTYVQGVDIDRGNFYQIVEEKKVIPKTSLPSPHQIMEYYRSIAQRGDEILSIHLGRKLSGTFEAVQMAAREIAGEYKVFPFDSGAGSAGLGFMCRDARLLDRAGASIQDILRRLEEIRQRLTVIFTLDNVEFARMNGRITALQSRITSLLKIKPIIVLRDGLLDMADKVRTRQRSIDRVLDFVKQRLGEQKVNLAVVHAADPEMARRIYEQVKGMFNLKELVMTELSIPVAANLGPGAIGIIAYPSGEDD